jgi:hypothetical protein
VARRDRCRQSSLFFFAEFTILLGLLFRAQALLWQQSKRCVPSSRYPSPATVCQSSMIPDLLMRPSQNPTSRLASLLLATLCASTRSDASLTGSKKKGRRRRHPPPATACKSWYPDLLMRPTQAPTSRRLAELKCCASLCFCSGFSTDTFVI